MELFIFSLKKFLTFQQRTCHIFFSNISSRENVCYIFPYKEAKFSKLKYFLVIIMKFFSHSFFLTLFYNQPVYFFHLLRDFCNMDYHIATFFLFLLQKDFNIFHKLSFVVSLFLDSINLIFVQTYMEKNHKIEI